MGTAIAGYSVGEVGKGGNVLGGDMRSGEVKSADEEVWTNGFLADMVGIADGCEIYVMVM